MMKKEQIFRAVGEVDEALLERSERAAQSGHRKRPVGRLAAGWVAAVLAVCILGTTTLASSQDIHIAKIFSRFFSGELSEGQEAALEPFGTTEFGLAEGSASVTDAGVTITPEMQLYDGNRLMLRLRLELADGVELPKPKGKSQYRFGSATGGMLEHINTYAGPDFTWEFGEEGNNTIYCTIDFQCINEAQELGEALHLKGIWLNYYELVLDGTWEIPFGELEVQKAYEIEISGHPIVKYYTGSDTTGRDFNIRLAGCAITPLTLRMDFEYFDHGQERWPEELYVMTKDGEKIETTGTSMGSWGLNEDGYTWENVRYMWEEPVVYDDIDYIQIGEVRVPVN